MICSVLTLYYYTDSMRRKSFMEFTPLFAYIDAGTGSMVLQTVAAGIFTAVLFFRQIRGWVLAQIHPSKKDDGKHDV